MIVLVAGTDQEYKSDKYGYAVKIKNSFKGRTDTIILAKFDPVHKQIAAINIPRDTRIFINGHRPEKINAINVIGGPMLLKKVLEDMLEIQIDHYVFVDTKGVEKVIDQAGGIEVDVPKKMVYKDMTDGLNINLMPGRKNLNGKEVVGFLRFRQDSLGDIGRIQRQQIFLRAIKEKLASPSIIPQLPQLTSTSLESVLTDMNVSDIIKLANFVKSTPSEAHILTTLPGEFSMPETETKVVYEEVPVQGSSSSSSGEAGGDEEPVETEMKPKVITVTAPFVSYWLPNESEITKVVQRMFKDQDLDESFEAKDIKVAIQDTTKDKVACKKLTTLLRKKGFQIVDIAGSQAKCIQSGVYAQKGNLKEAQFLHDEIGLPNKVKVLAGSMGFPMADITIIIGPTLEEELSKLEESGVANKTTH